MTAYNGFYLVGNYPDFELFTEALREGLRYFDFAEIGIPFSDPVADGPVIATAADAVLKAGFKWEKLLESVQKVRQSADSHKKLYWMSYANILYHHGLQNFIERSKEVGIDGIIVPDIPFVESEELKKLCHQHRMDYIHFATPENTDEQIKRIASAAQGFLYFVSIRGVTGSRLLVDDETARKIQLAKEYSPVPVILGFGIRDKKTVERALQLADGFIAGTALVKALGTGEMDNFTSLCKQLTGN